MYLVRSYCKLVQSLKKTFLFDAVSKICNPVKGGMMGMGGNLMGKAVSKVSGKDEKKEEEDVHEEHHKPKFVKHLNKTRTMSAKQKWEWAFDKILTVSGR